MNTHAQDQAVAAPLPNTRPVDVFVEGIRSAYTDSIAAVFEMGDLLCSAKQELVAADFNDMIDTKLPFGRRTAERLMKIAAHSGLADDATHVSLPPAWGTLHVLTVLKPGIIAKEISAGGIHAEMERKEAQALVDKYNKKKRKRRSPVRKRPDLKEANANLRTDLEAKQAYIDELEAARSGPATIDDARDQYAKFVADKDEVAISAELEKLKHLISELRQVAEATR
jgi:hypothetical protein